MSEGFIKNGMLSEDSHCDFDPSKKVKYIEKNGEAVASEENKHNLKEPVPISTNISEFTRNQEK